VVDTLAPIVAGRPVILLEFPNYPNVGDSAIYLGQLAALESLGIRPSFVCDLDTYDRDELADHVTPGAIILLTGGGSFGDLWPGAHRVREDVIGAFRHVPILQLPQTIHFESRDALGRTRSLLAAHGNVTLLVRDRRSLEIARREFPAPSALCPDMAFALGRLPRPATPDATVLWLLRTDKESAQTRFAHPGAWIADWIDEPSTLLRSLSYRLMGAVRRPLLRPVARALLMRIYEPLARQRLARGVRLLSRARVVVTDRLHGHILSLLLGIPHVLLDNSYGKLSHHAETWTSDVAGVRWASTLDEAAVHADELLRGAVDLQAPRA
jgi:pyruvyl transferase EpsO